MYDAEGSPEANYWIARNKLRSEFGLSAREADEEPAVEAHIHLNIWRWLNERQEFEQQKAEMRARVPKG